ncbi:hypothetical protein ABFG93_16840 [Pseudalkalibacillus hwajinpoensis]|uniref:hypothetical protein n=1 Tax=Guptibacillus hwajinpoensis TaxID=208199 RepID=UPI00325A7292
MNITEREAEMIRTALTTLAAEHNGYRAILDKLVPIATTLELSDLDSFMNETIQYKS